MQFFSGFTSSISLAAGLWGFGWTYPTPIDVDFSAHTLRASSDAFSVSYPPDIAPLKLRLNLQATFDPATGTITGTLRSDDGDFSGNVTGHFYGPAAAEIGLIVAMRWQQGSRPIIGLIAATR